ncbi:hypothetical protein ARALYDRAFT_917542 [Arabidopsis lyrata subsp. lyrata]|uniref:Reverse transcriptase zinc-binding domain-containing protein n=1 Tax=Arabidopsis lyrata subsp. lyrata TaxID=81972 RepID=D7MTE9_ARALL|nr:hypothetical protein ARALYDRAFT_917542 [Arabidopsis lyrata subsp. lyrata]
MARTRHSTVANAVQGTQWRVRRCRSQTLRNVVTKLQEIAPPQRAKGPDKPLWRYTLDDYDSSFTSRHTWNLLRKAKHKVLWHNSVWFPQRVPRYSFIVWLAVKDQLSTGTRMRAWGVEQPCVFCRERDESRDHLFFACPFTYSIWSELTSRLLRRKLNPDWSRTLLSLRSPQLTKRDQNLLCMIFQTTLYMVWKRGMAGTTIKVLTRHLFYYGPHLLIEPAADVEAW